MYVSDSFNQVVRKINVSTGAVTTLAGYQPDGAVQDVDGTGSNARLNYPGGIAVDKNGNVYVAEETASTIRKITPGGVVTTLAGTFTPNGNYEGSADGTGPAAHFYAPWGIAVDAKGTLYLADWGNCTIRKITSTGVVTTLGGAPVSNGMNDATGSGARFYLPAGIASDATGKIYIADSWNSEIRVGVLADLKITCTDGKTSVANLSFGYLHNHGDQHRSGKPEWCSCHRYLPGSGAECDLYGDGKRWRDRVLGRQRQH